MTASHPILLKILKYLLQNRVKRQVFDIPPPKIEITEHRYIMNRTRISSWPLKEKNKSKVGRAKRRAQDDVAGELRKIKNV